jgi:major vault protein
VTTCFLRVSGARVSDTFEVESIDFVKLRVKLGFSGHFEGEPEKWFSVDDPVKLLADTVRARLRESARQHPFARLVREMGTLVHETTSELVFDENGMVVDACELLKLDIVDPALQTLFTDAQREIVKLEIKDEEATRRLTSERHQDLVDAEEHAIVRSAVVRKAESRLVDAEADHRVELKKLQLRIEQETTQRDEEIKSADSRSEAEVLRRRKEAEVDEAHLAKLAELDIARARAMAEAEALRLQAIQPELIGALHSAADAEVMKAAAENMNLVSLLGGKSPQELFEQVLKGTPLERSTRDMRSRSQPKTNGNGEAE